MNKILRLSLLCLLTISCGALVSAAEETIDFTQLSITTNTDGFTLTSGIYTFTALKNLGATAPTQNGTAKDIRCYAKNTLKIASTSGMTKIVFNMSTQGLIRWADITADAGTITIDKGAKTTTWENTSAVSSVTLTVGDLNVYGTDPTTKAGQFDFNSAVFTTSGSAQSIAAPTITGTTPFVGTTDVTITGETGSTIYYTLDGTDPTTASTTTGASPLTFSLNKTATVKAIAVSGSLTSTVTSKDFTLANYTDKTIADINTLTADLQFVNLKLSNAKVVYVNGTSISVREGDKAVILYDTGLTLPLNSTISGDVKVDYDSYNGVHEIKKNADTNADNLTITTSTSTDLDPTTATIPELIALNHIADLIKLTGVTITKGGTTSSYFAVSGTDKIQLYSKTNASLYTQLADDGKTYSIIAVFNNIYQGAAEIEPVNIDSNTTGINNISFDNDNNTPSFNLNGQRVSDSFKGVIVKKGKKYISKQ